MHTVFRRQKACFEHSNLFKVNVPAHRTTRLRAARRELRAPARTGAHRQDVRTGQLNTASGETVRYTDPTTSFLTATTLIYANGAGITAAAGTRLASIRYSLKDLKCSHSDYGASDESRIVIFRHYLPVPGAGNLRACCLPWMR